MNDVAMSQGDTQPQETQFSIPPSPPRSNPEFEEPSLQLPDPPQTAGAQPMFVPVHDQYDMNDFLASSSWGHDSSMSASNTGRSQTNQLWEETFAPDTGMCLADHFARLND